MGSKEEKLRKARALYASKRNCAQMTAVPFAQECGVDETVLLRMLSSFGGGVAGMKETCGVITGIATVVGLTEDMALSSDVGDKTFMKVTTQSLIRKFMAKFEYTQCQQLAAELEKNPNPSDDPDFKAYPCGKLVEAGVEILYDYLSE